MTRKQDVQLCSSASESPATGGQPVTRKRGAGSISKSKTGAAAESTSSRVLCPTCMHVDGCVLFSNGERPAWHCEEFAAVGAPPRAARREASPMASRLEEQKHLGLCVNCDDRDTCTFPRPEGGVWRCNEYR